MRARAETALTAGWVLLAAAGASARGSAPLPAIDPCALLADAEVKSVQGEAVEERKRTEQSNRSFRTAQCFYRTATFTRSVSVAVAVPQAPNRSGPRAYWRETFHRTKERSGREPPPRPVPGLGEEAYWVGDRRIGALYVLEGDVFLRLSVGGVADEGARLEKARALGDSALRRLPSTNR